MGDQIRQQNGARLSLSGRQTKNQWSDRLRCAPGEEADGPAPGAEEGVHPEDLQHEEGPRLPGVRLGDDALPGRAHQRGAVVKPTWRNIAKWTLIQILPFYLVCKWQYDARWKQEWEYRRGEVPYDEPWRRGKYHINPNWW